MTDPGRQNSRNVHQPGAPTRVSTPIPLVEPFRIGVRPLAWQHWLRGDETAASRVAERERLRATGAAIYAALDETETAQAEAYALILDWHRRFGRLVNDVPGGCGGDDEHPRHDPDSHAVGRANGYGQPPGLLRAGTIAAEDLALMRRDDAGWRLVAGAIAFPSFWRLEDKLGRPMAEVHAPVPGFGAGSAQNRVIERMFDALRPGKLVERGNWSLHDSDRLHHPEPSSFRYRAPRHVDALPEWLRQERQTLRKLPASGDILFTIDVLTTPVSSLSQEVRSSLVARVQKLDAAQRIYRGVTN